MNKILNSIYNFLDKLTSTPPDSGPVIDERFKSLLSLIRSNQIEVFYEEKYEESLHILSLYDVEGNCLIRYMWNLSNSSGWPSGYGDNKFFLNGYTLQPLDWYILASYAKNLPANVLSLHRAYEAKKEMQKLF